MKRVGVLLLSIVFVALTSSAPVVAETVQLDGGRLQVSAKILPAHSVIVDNTGTIQQIASNTEGRATLRAFLNDYNQQVDITPYIQAQYDSILPTGTAFIGIVYDRESVPPLLVPTKPSAAGRLTIEDLLRPDLAL